MSRPLVTVGGPPGSGKTTAARAAAARLGLEYQSAGELFRAEASRGGMDLAAFSRYAESEPAIDRKLDERMIELARPGHLLEGRITGALCRRKGIPVLSVVVTAREEVRAQRLAHRDGLPIAAARRAMLARERSERARYGRYYAIDLDREPADLTIESSDRTPDQVVAELVDFVQRRTAEQRS